MNAEDSPAQGRSVPALLNSLTGRELEVLRLLSTGKSNKEIARALRVSPSTVGSHVSQILKKLGVVGRTEAAVLWVSNVRRET